MPASIILSAVASGGAGFLLGAGTAAAFTSAALVAGLKVGIVTGVLSFAARSLTKPSRPTAQTGTADSRTINQTVNGPERARWVIGKARVAGQIVFLKENPNDEKELHMLQVFSNDACLGVSKLWVDSEVVRLQRNMYVDGESLEVQFWLSVL